MSGSLSNPRVPACLTELISRPCIVLIKVVRWQLQRNMALFSPVMVLLVAIGFLTDFVVTGLTDPQDAAALRALEGNWQNTPPSWEGPDPCGSAWEGVSCTGSQVTSLSLSSMDLKGTLASDIGYLTGLRSLDLSYNKKLSGEIPNSLGNLVHLDTLIMIGCGFTGSIPTELGNLRNLTFLALNSNKLSGQIPPSLGNLAQLYWLDIADNMIGGALPVSTQNAPGIDKLSKAKHFHLGKNRLTGSIPDEIFNSNMQLIHVLFDSNMLSGRIPSSVAAVSNLEILRLDRNSLHGPVPSTIGSLTKLNELHLSHNKLEGSVPDLSAMSSLNYVDLSNNSFDASEAPGWFRNLTSLTTLVMENGRLGGEVPSELFSLPQLQTVKLRKNNFNKSLNMGANISPQLQLVDLEYNGIPDASLGQSYTKTLLLFGNPVCENGSPLASNNVCKPPATDVSYATSLRHCGGISCSGDLKLSPQSCQCAVPYEGVLVFRSPSFSDIAINRSRFHNLEESLWVNLALPRSSVFLCCLAFDSNNYLNVQLQLFPSSDKYFNRTEIQRIGFSLSGQTYKPPREFGPFSFIASPYPFPDSTKATGLSSGKIIGIAVGASVLSIAVLAVGVYALVQKRKADKAIELSKPSASWGASCHDSGGAPKLKGARWFSFEELKKYTNNFCQANEIGWGGYGKVYKGFLADAGQMLAIKRARQGSMQGGAEFKNEVELLSRVHHKNLVGLIGFCFEQGEQMLVYEYMSNGTLRESLSGRSGIHLDWQRRVRIALGSAKGLAYLHELADPPIIHRDVKSSNILLDGNLTAKVADFGVSKLIPDGDIDAGDKGHVSTQVKGTLGYLDPEYYMTQQLTTKSDVYSFGVVLLEIITGRQTFERGKYIVREVKADLERGGVNQILDPLLRDLYAPAPGSGIGNGIESFVKLALRCVEESAADRPSMSDVVKELECIAAKDGGSICPLTSDSAPFKPHSNAFYYSGGYTVPPPVEPK